MPDGFSTTEPNVASLDVNPNAFPSPVPDHIRAEADADPELARAFNGAIREEDARFLHWQRDATRYSGVAWSGLGPNPFDRRTPEALLALARDRLAADRAWKASPDGALAREIEALDAYLVGAIQTLGEVRNARSRGLSHATNRVIATQRLEEIAAAAKRVGLGAQRAAAAIELIGGAS